mmetsp:Transcript_91122/g.266781  ORF Transcript_91122/g.266781 Transcript_91122/m.266781 type:complete len:306 (+) Transcript_91122:650-1567(+)
MHVQLARHIVRGQRNVRNRVPEPGRQEEAAVARLVGRPHLLHARLPPAAPPAQAAFASPPRPLPAPGLCRPARAAAGASPGAPLPRDPALHVSALALERVPLRSPAGVPPARGRGQAMVRRRWCPGGGHGQQGPGLRGGPEALHEHDVLRQRLRRGLGGRGRGRGGAPGRALLRGRHAAGHGLHHDGLRGGHPPGTAGLCVGEPAVREAGHGARGQSVAEPAAVAVPEDPGVQPLAHPQLQHRRLPVPAEELLALGAAGGEAAPLRPLHLHGALPPGRARAVHLRAPGGHPDHGGLRRRHHLPHR